MNCTATLSDNGGIVLYHSFKFLLMRQLLHETKHLFSHIISSPHHQKFCVALHETVFETTYIEQCALVVEENLPYI
jgi:hypothetical protein